MRTEWKAWSDPSDHEHVYNEKIQGDGKDNTQRTSGINKKNTGYK